MHLSHRDGICGFGGAKKHAQVWHEWLALKVTNAGRGRLDWSGAFAFREHSDIEAYIR
jgi:hypothetical protein